MGLLDRATCTVHSISTQRSQERIECTKDKEQLFNLYTVVTGAFINLAVILFLRLWTPNPDDAYVFFIIAAFWGISDAIWQTQINGKHF